MNKHLTTIRLTETHDRINFGLSLVETELLTEYIGLGLFCSVLLYPLLFSGALIFNGEFFTYNHV